MTLLRRVISGGQVGADIAGVRAAKRKGLETGGFMPKGFRMKSGAMPADWVEHYGFEETESEGYPSRTRMNVAAADGTIQIAYDFASPGERLTSRCVRELGKTRYCVELRKTAEGFQIVNYNTSKTEVDQVVEWIVRNKIETLNIAGNGDVNIEGIVEAFISLVIEGVSNQLPGGGEEDDTYTSAATMASEGDRPPTTTVLP